VSSALKKSLAIAEMRDDEAGSSHRECRLSYDTLRHGGGNRITNDFVLLGVGEYAIPMETPGNRRAASTAGWSTHSCARNHAGRAREAGTRHVAIIGAGATGLSWRRRLHNTVRTVISYGLERIDPTRDGAHRGHRGCRPNFAGASRKAVKFCAALLQSPRS